MLPVFVSRKTAFLLQQGFPEEREVAEPPSSL
jgi:hypothetical protein